MIGWKPPVEGWVKVNIDGACKSESVAGCGGIIRNNRGGWLGGFAKHIGSCSAFVAELWGVLEGLKHSGVTSSAMGITLIKNIRRMLALNWNVHEILAGW
ncbi:ribonuclease H protein [Trifolium medium]|uniref:Ribonuclease H protein n=1 Tax=Trifolium medium TaxID=97028 RepID=A0A392QYA2_9FABA|nr:ribonuclease H protein [Trifolium medium]